MVAVDVADAVDVAVAELEAVAEGLDVGDVGDVVAVAVVVDVGVAEEPGAGVCGDESAASCGVNVVEELPLPLAILPVATSTAIAAMVAPTAATLVTTTARREGPFGGCFALKRRDQRWSKRWTRRPFA